MKFSLNSLIVVSLFAWGLTSCNAGTSTSITPGKDSTATAAAESPSDLGHEGTYVDYSDDWGAFKSAVINKSIEGMKMYMKADIDPQNLLDMMSPEVIKAMEDTKYAQLKDSDYNGTKVKEWDYQESGVDEEGNEVGMGLFYYFEEQKEGLRLIGYLAAG